MSVRSRFTRLSRQIALGGGVLILSTASISQAAPNQNSRSVFNRTKLPIAEPKPEKVTKVLPSEVPLPPQWEVTAPADAPNVVIILLDDVGYAAPSAFGGAVNGGKACQ